MKVMKRIAAALAAGIMLAGCGNSTASSHTASQTSAPSASTSAPAAAETAQASVETKQPSGENGSEKILIMYFDQGLNSEGAGDQDVDAVTSASLAGGIPDGIEANDIRVMKDEIASVTGGDTYAVEINEVYAPRYEDMVGQAQQDQDNDKQFTFRSQLPDISRYDVIFFGTPVWWGHLPQPVVNVFQQLDFSGKTIIPFGIHLGSRFGSMLNQMAELEPDAAISQDGLTISGHTTNAEARQDVDDWLAGLSY